MKEIRMTQNFQRENFCLASAEEASFSGFHDPLEDWNGWACPYFEYNIALSILELVSSSNGDTWDYVEDEDTFYVNRKDAQDSGAPEEFSSLLIEFEDKEIKVYGIGAYYWIWEVCE